MVQLASKNKVFSDLDLDFDIHPNTKQLVMKTGDAAVVQSVKNLIATNHYERPFHPEKGCGIRNSLFENVQPSTAKSIANWIEEVIRNYEPRVRIDDLEVIAKPEENGYNVTLRMFIINEAISRTVNLFLERIR